jgi:hypothetical protein
MVLSVSTLQGGRFLAAHRHPEVSMFVNFGMPTTASLPAIRRCNSGPPSAFICAAGNRESETAWSLAHEEAEDEDDESIEDDESEDDEDDEDDDFEGEENEEDEDDEEEAEEELDEA